MATGSWHGLVAVARGLLGTSVSASLDDDLTTNAGANLLAAACLVRQRARAK
jgi:hypothetical protein